MCFNLPARTLHACCMSIGVLSPRKVHPVDRRIDNEASGKHEGRVSVISLKHNARVSSDTNWNIDFQSLMYVPLLLRCPVSCQISSPWRFLVVLESCTSASGAGRTRIGPGQQSQCKLGIYFYKSPIFKRAGMLYWGARGPVQWRRCQPLGTCP